MPGITGHHLGSSVTWNHSAPGNLVCQGQGLGRDTRPAAAPATRGGQTGVGHMHRGRKGFGYRVRRGPGPGNTTVRDLLSDDRYIGLVLDFLKTTRAGEVKAGPSEDASFPPFPFPFPFFLFFYFPFLSFFALPFSFSFPFLFLSSFSI